MWHLERWDLVGLICYCDKIRLEWESRKNWLGTAHTSNRNDMIGRVFHSVFSHRHFVLLTYTQRERDSDRESCQHREQNERVGLDHIQKQIQGHSARHERSAPAIYSSVTGQKCQHGCVSKHTYRSRQTDTQQITSFQDKHHSSLDPEAEESGLGFCVRGKKKHF